MLRVLEGQLIYFPARVTGDGPPLRVDGAASVEEVWLETGDGLRIHGVRALAADGGFLGRDSDLGSHRLYRR